jgi:hypothetical protein
MLLEPPPGPPGDPLESELAPPAPPPPPSPPGDEVKVENPPLALTEVVPLVEKFAAPTVTVLVPPAPATVSPIVVPGLTAKSLNAAFIDPLPPDPPAKPPGPPLFPPAVTNAASLFLPAGIDTFCVELYVPSSTYAGFGVIDEEAPDVKDVPLEFVNVIVNVYACPAAYVAVAVSGEDVPLVEMDTDGLDATDADEIAAAILTNDYRG